MKKKTTKNLVQYSYVERLPREKDDNEVEDEDNYFCETIAHDHYRLRKARTTHGSVFDKPHSPVAEKPLAVEAASQLETQGLITKKENVSKVVEQFGDPVFNTVPSCVYEGISIDLKAPEIQQSKVLL